MGNPRTHSPNHSLQAFRLVGRFLYRWGAIEELITANIKYFLKMSGPEADIILANVTFRDKVQILSTLITLAYGEKDRSSAEQSQRTFGKILDFNMTYRNCLAHNPFQPAKSGIELKRIQAKGKYSVSKTIWSAAFFKQRFSEMDSFEERIGAIISNLKRRDGAQRIARALSTHDLAASNLTTGSPFYSLPVLGLFRETPLALRLAEEKKSKTLP